LNQRVKLSEQDIVMDLRITTIVAELHPKLEWLQTHFLHAYKQPTWMAVATLDTVIAATERRCCFAWP
jgi:midasin (ATPase involved in ribosome maturation)